MDKIYKIYNRIQINPILSGIRKLPPISKPVNYKFSQIILFLEDF